MNLRLSLRYFLSVLLAFCIVFSNSFCGIAKADSTTVQAYDIMPTAIYEDDDIYINFKFDVLDSDLNDIFYSSNTVQRLFPANVRFNGFNFNNYIGYNSIDNVTPLDNTNTVRVTLSITDASGASNPVVAMQLLGYTIDLYAFSAEFRYYLNDSVVASQRLTRNKPVKVQLKNYDSNGILLSTENVNLNNIQILQPNDTVRIVSNYMQLNSAPVSSSVAQIHKIDVILYYELDSTIIPESYDRLFLRSEFPVTNAYISGVYDSTGDSYNNSDYNQNVEAELGNINTGIGNVVNCLTNLGNQAVQNTQNIINSVSQMTTNISNVIDQQRQDILNGLGLLGDNLSTELENVKTEISNMSSNIVGKLESTTETITNTIETKVDEVTTAVEDVKSSILDLPNKIQEMLIGLVVPDEETINAKYAEFDELLSSRFGLIYQSADIIHDFADSFQTQAVMTADTGGIITMPSVTVNLADSQFTFGGYDVDIIPNGFEFLQQSLRLAISMVCTVVFVNMCKNKLEAILK